MNALENILIKSASLQESFIEEHRALESSLALAVRCQWLDYRSDREPTCSSQPTSPISLPAAICSHSSVRRRAGEIAKPVFRDPGAELLRELGNRHEQAFLRHLAETKDVVEIPTADISWADAVARTVEALRRGADAVYQATFQDGPWGGRSDFLIRVDKPSALGPFSYEVVETKLARSAKARAILQLCFYSELLSKIQGVPPDWMYVVLGGGYRSGEIRRTAILRLLSEG